MLEDVPSSRTSLLEPRQFLCDFGIGSDLLKKPLFKRTALPKFIEGRLLDEAPAGNDAHVRAEALHNVQYMRRQKYCGPALNVTRQHLADDSRCDNVYSLKR